MSASSDSIDGISASEFYSSWKSCTKLFENYLHQKQLVIFSKQTFNRISTHSTFLGKKNM